MSEKYNYDYNEQNGNDYNNKKSKKKYRIIKGVIKIVASAMVVGLVAGAAFQVYNQFINYKGNNIGKNIDETDYQGSSEHPDIEEEDITTVETSASGKVLSGDVSDVVSNVMPSIVAINSIKTNVVQDFFGRRINEDVASTGSGIIIAQTDSEILIATNNHVVSEAKAVEIVFYDETNASASIKGTAPNSDLAVVSVKINDLDNDTIDKIKLATLGDSDSLKLGQMAIAIGNALGYGQSTTVGYISALEREISIENVTLKVLQTDAAINPGNSGGALLNSKGEVIGINSVKSIDDAVENMGYAIPISDAIPIVNELMNRDLLEDEEKGYLGIAGRDITKIYSQRFNMPVGVYVGEVVEDSPADKAGIKVGDIIVTINGIPVESMPDLQDVLNYTKAGSTGTVVVKTLESGEYIDKTLSVTFSARPEN